MDPNSTQFQGAPTQSYNWYNPGPYPQSMFAAPIGPSSPGYVQGSANTVASNLPQSTLSAQQPAVKYFQPPANVQPVVTQANGVSQSNLVQAQQGLTDAQIKELSDQYDAIAAKLGLAKEHAFNTYNLGKNDIQNSLSSTLGLYGNAEENARNQKSQNESAAFQRFQDLGLQNRNIARAQGALESSYYGDLQNRAGLDYSRYLGTNEQNFGNTLKDLEIRRTAAAQSAQADLAKLANQYQNDVNSISIDENLSAQQKADKINTARADLESRVGQLQLAMKQIDAYMNMYKGNASSALTQAQGYQPTNPYANFGSAGVPSGGTPTSSPVGNVGTQSGNWWDNLAGIGNILDNIPLFGSNH